MTRLIGKDGGADRGAMGGDRRQGLAQDNSREIANEKKTKAPSRLRAVVARCGRS